jgi:hypothetical protein
MQRLLEILLGIEPAPWTEGGGWRLGFVALPSGDRALLTLALLAAAAWGVWWLYRREAHRVGPVTRWLLVAIRTSIILLVALMMVEPVIVLSRTERVPSNLLVLVDTSRSMGLTDSWDDAQKARAAARAAGLDDINALRTDSRLALAGMALSGALLEDLALGGERIVRVHTFSDRLNDAADSVSSADSASIDTPNGGPAAKGAQAPRVAALPPLEAAGQATAIGSALSQALTAYRGLPLAGVLIVTDGQSNSGPPAMEAAQLIAAEGVPLAALAMGTEQGPRNARIARLEVNPIVFVRDTSQVTAYLESSGMSDTLATVTLHQRRNGGPWEIVGQEQVALDTAGRLQAVGFPFSQPQPCKLQFRATLEDTGHELTTDDNTAMADVQVIRQKLRVLFVAGSTFPEVQFIRNALMRDRGIELSAWLQTADEDYEQPGDAVLRRLPNTRQELDRYDAVLLYDPDPRRWGPRFSELLSEFVAESGGGLVLIAGEHQTADLFDRPDDPLMSWVRLLPVVRRPGLFRSQVQTRLSTRSAWKLDITERGRRDPIFAFAKDPQQNEQVLASLPGMFWHFPVTRAKPGAAVLARHGDPRMRNEFGPEVLLATQPVGPGRTFFVGFDSTYRWRYLDEGYFDGFWARLVDRAGRNKLLGGTYPFRLSTDRATYRPGSRVRLTASMIDPGSAGPPPDTLQGQVERGADAPIPVTLSPGAEPGVYRARFTVDRAGPHSVRVWAGDQDMGSIVKAATLTVDVELPNLEYDSPTLDLAGLEALTTATGGQAFEFYEADKVPGVFRTGLVDRVLEDRQEVWDAPLLYMAVFGLLVTEWLIRKRHRLV